MENAVDRDPDNWETHYGLALVRAADRPRPDAGALAAAASTRASPAIQEAIREMRGDRPPQEWERRAREARLPF